MYHDIPTKSQIKVWVIEEEVLVQVRKSKSTVKRMITVFFTKGGILTTISLEKFKTVTAKWYTETCTSGVRDTEVFGGNRSSTIGTPCI